MQASAIIEVSRLTKYYGAKLGVRDISFAVNSGEIFGFLGPNGAGKTTTIRLLLDLLRPSSGQISIFGDDLFVNSTTIRKRCGYLPGNFSAYGHMAGHEFLSFAAALRRASKLSQAGLCERFALTQEDLSQKLKHMSHGTLQKLGIIQAFFHEPELLILDEPTIGLDPLMQEAFYDLLHETRKRGRTIFFSSHNLPEVEKVCHRVAIIREGTLVALETLESLVKKRYRRLKVALNKPVEHLQLPGAREVRRDGLVCEFLVTGDVKPILQRLSDLPVEDVVFPEADLEEVFLAYYRDEKNA